jgi:muramoyltetrapeptide carboxypeptidase
VKDGGVYFYPRTQWHVLKKGRAAGRLFGGNLLSFVNLLGTPYCPDLKNSILFLEEHDDFTEDVENSFVRLINANVLGGNMVQGIILGKFVNVDVGSDDPEYKKLTPPKGFTFYKIVQKLFENYDIPILANVDFGLINTPLTIPVGAKATMDLTGHKDRPYFKLNGPAVR